MKYDALLRQLLAPFFALSLLLLARYIARFIVPYIPEGAIKRFLTKRRSSRSAFFERQDARLFGFVRSMLRKARGQ